MREDLKQLLNESSNSVNSCLTLDELNEVRVKYLGKKGELTALLKSMKDISPEERPIFGQDVNQIRNTLEALISEKKEFLNDKKINEKLTNETIDINLPSKRKYLGHRHVNSLTMNEIINIFVGLGYEIVEGPEVELDYYNFEALNIPENHPAKDEQDTFFINDKVVLRTQTSPVQIRVMEKSKPPIKILAPGRVFRADEVDATHSPIFHQIEGLVVDKGITFSDLKGTLEVFAQKFFGKDTKVKFRPHHFPFTEPSAEVDVSCFKCGGDGCSFCKESGWVEILGCGMVHPDVLRRCGIDPNEYSGFAFGMGLERIGLFKYEIDDLRLLYENEVRFLKQF